MRPGSVTGCPYYHPAPTKEDRDRVEALLTKRKEDGCFLIRDSTTSEGYILCLFVESSNKVVRYRIKEGGYGGFFVEAAEDDPYPATSPTLSDLIETYLSRDGPHGFQTSLKHGIKKDGTVSSDEESDADEDLDDSPYHPLAEFSSRSEPPPVTTPPPTHPPLSLMNRSVSTQSHHIYADPDRPDGDQEIPRNRKVVDGMLKRLDQAANTCGNSSEFTSKVRTYIKNDLPTDTSRVTSPEPSSAGQMKCLRTLIEQESEGLLCELKAYSRKLALISHLFSPNPSADINAALSKLSVDGESKFNRLIGLMTSTKRELEALEQTAAESLRNKVAYSNVDITTIPVTSFIVRQHKILSSLAIVLTVDVNAGVLKVAKDTSASVDIITAKEIIQVIKSTNNTTQLEVRFEGKKKEVLFFSDISSREHFCQLLQQLMSKHLPSQARNDTLSIFCGTWNMGNEPPPRQGLGDWLRSQGEGKTILPELSNDPHDLYAIGVQESKVSEAVWVTSTLDLLRDLFGINFHLVDVCSMWQIRVLVCVKPELKTRISHVKHGHVATGIANTLGNKGAAAVSFNFDGSSLLFISCHLAANRERIARRNQNSRDIIKGLNSKLGDKKYSDFGLTNQYNYVFWVGDLNYRTEDDSPTAVIQTLKKQTLGYQQVLKKDQLFAQINGERAFFGFYEEEITFQPTYRYHKGGNTFDWKKIKKSGIKLNAPSYCDRVLWKNYPHSDINNTSYGIVRNIKTSDHKPVFATFTARMLPQNIHRSVQKLKDPIKIMLKDLSCEIHSGMKEGVLQFNVIVMSQCLEGSYSTIRPSQLQSDSRALPAEVKWSETLTLTPSFSDITYLAEQHLLLAVKSATTESWMVGDGVVSLLKVFNLAGSNDRMCQFEVDITYLGSKKGILRGTIEAETSSSLNTLVPPTTLEEPRRHIIMNDVYASPLSDLYWDGDDKQEAAAYSAPSSQAYARVRARPKSVVFRMNPVYSTKSIPSQKSFDVGELPNAKLQLPLRPSPPVAYQNHPLPKATQQPESRVYDSPSSMYESKPAPKPRHATNDYLNVPSHVVLNKDLTEKPPLPQKSSSVKEARHAMRISESDQQQESSKPPLPAQRAKGAPVNRRPEQPPATAGENPISTNTDSSDSIKEVEEWLNSQSMSQYLEIFIKQGWTSLKHVAELNQEDISNSGVGLRHIFRLLDAAKML